MLMMVLLSISSQPAAAQVTQLGLSWVDRDGNQAAPPSSFTKEGTAREPWTRVPVVSLLDSGGVLDTSATNVVKLESTQGVALTGVLEVTAVAGIAKFDGLVSTSLGSFSGQFSLSDDVAIFEIFTYNIAVILTHLNLNLNMQTPLSLSQSPCLPISPSPFPSGPPPHTHTQKGIPYHLVHNAALHSIAVSLVPSLCLNHCCFHPCRRASALSVQTLA